MGVVEGIRGVWKGIAVQKETIAYVYCLLQITFQDFETILFLAPID